MMTTELKLSTLSVGKPEVGHPLNGEVAFVAREQAKGYGVMARVMFNFDFDEGASFTDIEARVKHEAKLWLQRCADLL